MTPLCTLSLSGRYFQKPVNVIEDNPVPYTVKVFNINRFVRFLIAAHYLTFLSRQYRAELLREGMSQSIVSNYGTRHALRHCSPYHLHYFFNGTIKLGILPCEIVIQIIDHGNIRLDSAHGFDILSVKGIASPEREPERSAVQQSPA